MRRLLRESIEALRAGIDAKHAANFAQDIKDRGPVDTGSRRQLQDLAMEVLRGLRSPRGDEVQWSGCDLRHGQHWPSHMKAAKLVLEAILEQPIVSQSRGAKPIIALPKLAVELHEERERQHKSTDRPRRGRETPRARDEVRTPRHRSSEQHVSLEPPQDVSRSNRLPAASSRCERSRSRPRSRRSKVSSRASIDTPCHSQTPRIFRALHSAARSCRESEADRCKDKRSVLVDQPSPLPGASDHLPGRRRSRNERSRSVRRSSASTSASTSLKQPPPQPILRPADNTGRVEGAESRDDPGHTSGGAAASEEEDLTSLARALLMSSPDLIDSSLVELLEKARGNDCAAAAILKLREDPSFDWGCRGPYAAFGLAYIVQHCAASKALIHSFFESDGNMQAVFHEDMQSFGDFIAKYPEALSALPGWAQQATGPSRLLQSCANALSEPGHIVSPQFLHAALGQPDSEIELCVRLVEAANGQSITGIQRERLRIMAAALVNTENPVEIVEKVANEGFNLLQALSPQHFGMALSTGLVPWPIVQLWSTPGSQRATTNVAQSDGLMTESEAGRPESVNEAQLRDQRTNVPQFPKGTPQRQRHGNQLTEVVLYEEDYADLRQELKPPCPETKEGEYGHRCGNPRSQPGVPICRFEAPNMDDVRQRRWHWWDACAEMEVFVREFYAFTEWTTESTGAVTPRGNRVPNATAGGQPGQEVVRTPWGTLTWIPHDRRIVVAPACPELERRVKRVFHPWRVDSDMAQVYHGRKVPRQIASAIGAPSSMRPFR